MRTQRLYTPIDSRYGLPGESLRLGSDPAGDLHMEIDTERERYLQAKHPCQGLWSDAVAREALENRVCRWLASLIDEEHDGLPDARPDDRQSLDALVGTMQEDLVVMHRESGSLPVHARAAYVNVSFPSGWCPACATGRTFLSIHSPVPHEGKFDGRRRQSAAQSLFGPEETVRFVWTLTPDAELDRRHCHATVSGATAHASREFSWLETSEIFLRVERQVISPLDAYTCCFLIRVYVYPVDNLCADTRNRLLSSLMSMSDEVRRYKGLAVHFDRIAALVGATT